MSDNDRPKAGAASEGRYLYCIADSGEQTDLGKIGLDGKEVYTLPFADLCAVIHNCHSEPYKSEDDEVVRRWVITHERVVEAAWERFGAVLPFGFDTIVKGEKGISPEENIINWLRDDCSNLKQKINKIRGKAEYGVQIFWDLTLVADEISKANQEIRNMDRDAKSKPEGMAYMLKHKLENLLKKEIEKKANLYFKDFYTRIKRCVDEIKVEKIKKVYNKKQMLMNLSCLIDRERSSELGKELEKINKEDGFTVRFTGPWPPYSFVAPG